jgi:hypothetical protein
LQNDGVEDPAAIIVMTLHKCKEPIVLDPAADGLDASNESAIEKSRVGMRTYPSFTTLAKALIDLTSSGAVRFRKHYLDRSTLSVSEEIIGSSGTSEVFRGYLGVQPVAVKRLRMDVIGRDCSKSELKDLLTEIDFMCRFFPLILVS